MTLIIMFVSVKIMSTNSPKNISSSFLSSDVGLSSPILPVTKYASPSSSAKQLISSEHISNLIMCNRLASEKRSSDVALGQLQITSDLELKRVRHRLSGAERGRDDLASELKSIKTKLAATELEADRFRELARTAQLEAQTRVDSFLETRKCDYAMSEVSRLFYSNLFFFIIIWQNKLS